MRCPLEPAAMPTAWCEMEIKNCADRTGSIKSMLGLGMMRARDQSNLSATLQREVDLAQCRRTSAGVRRVQKPIPWTVFSRSRAQMSCLPRLGPQKFYDMWSGSTFDRGPLSQNGNPYLNGGQVGAVLCIHCWSPPSKTWAYRCFKSTIRWPDLRRLCRVS